VFLIGWAVGGFLFGMIGDKLGRTRTMTVTILIYAVFTGLTGLTHDPFWYGVCRFFTALGVGGEFAAGAALVAEVFPQRSRTMALGLLQAVSAVGNGLAAVITLSLANVENSWRIAYFIGAFPAVLVFFIRRLAHEPEQWAEAKVKAAQEGTAVGSIPALFTDPTLRRNTIAGTLLAIAGVGGLWGVGFWMPDLIGEAFKPLNLSKADMATVRAYVFMVQQAGAFLGMLGYTILAEKMGRKPALWIALIAAFLSVQGTFYFVHDHTTAYIWAFLLGLCALSPFAAYAVYFPELFPTRLRATGVGFCYNCARIVAAGAPLALGSLAKVFDNPAVPASGLRVAASIVAFIYVFGIAGILMAPETRGKPLPE
jgi:MFS family permease